MLALRTDRRSGVEIVCGRIQDLLSAEPIISEDHKIHWPPGSLLGTEGPIWTSISPRIDQIIPPSVAYDDLEALFARRQQLLTIRSKYCFGRYNMQPLWIWTHLYLGYTMYHHPSQTMSGRALPLLGTPLVDVSYVANQNLHDEIRASLMSAFGWFTQQLNPAESIKICERLVDSHHSGRLTDHEKQDLVAFIQHSKFLAFTGHASPEVVQSEAFEELLDSSLHHIPLQSSVVRAIMATRLPLIYLESVANFQERLLVAYFESRSLFGPESESRLTTQLAIHSQLCEFPTVESVDPERFVLLDRLPRLLELFGPENQDVKLVVGQIKTALEEAESYPSRSSRVSHRARDMLSSLKL
jgi:hypothetical protein